MSFGTETTTITKPVFCRVFKVHHMSNPYIYLNLYILGDATFIWDWDKTGLHNKQYKSAHTYIIDI
jgi:hypothetical protein